MRAPDSNHPNWARTMALALLMLATRPAIAAHHPKTASSPKAPAASSSAPAPAAASNVAAGTAASVPSSAAEAPEPVVTAVHIERLKPEHEHYPTLQFFRTNVGFIRGRIDLLRERPLPESAGSCFLTFRIF